MADGALTGLKVLEFGNLVSAAYCGKLMADLGAEVIKIEEPGRGDEARSRGPFAGGEAGLERSGLFAYLNHNKLSVTLDPKTGEGKAIFMELVKQADFLIENNPPPVMDELGLTYEVLEKVNPMLIMTSITPFGQTGPYRNYKAYELNTLHGGGHGFVTSATYAEPVPTPVKSGGRQSQFGAGVTAATASMCALFARENIGSGQHVDLSMQECLAGQYEAAIEHWTYTENELGGISVPIMGPIMPLPCKDGWIHLMCVEDHEYDRFVEVMGNPEWADNELFADRFIRGEYLDALVIFLVEWTSERTKEEVFQMAQAARVPVGPAYTSEEVVNSEHLNARAFFVEIDHPVIGRTKYPGAPYRFSETPWNIERPAPLLGEHNELILGGRLGYSNKGMEKLSQTNII
ncbi:MAG: CoA transferase [Deltaproteobacteria bacterium]|nr:CoA transferase [Deltaproteobacteria bacterium]